MYMIMNICSVPLFKCLYALFLFQLGVVIVQSWLLLKWLFLTNKKRCFTVNLIYFCFIYKLKSKYRIYALDRNWLIKYRFAIGIFSEFAYTNSKIRQVPNYEESPKQKPTFNVIMQTEKSETQTQETSQLKKTHKNIVSAIYSCTFISM